MFRTVTKGDSIRVRHWVNPEWVVASTVEGDHLGMVPVGFLSHTPHMDHLLHFCESRGDPLQSVDKLVEKSADEAAVEAAAAKCPTAIAVHDVVAEHDLELSLTAGAAVSLVQWVDANWVIATTQTGAAGIVPAGCLVPDPSTLLPQTNVIANEV